MSARPHPLSVLAWLAGPAEADGAATVADRLGVDQYWPGSASDEALDAVASLVDRAIGDGVLHLPTTATALRLVRTTDRFGVLAGCLPLLATRDGQTVTTGSPLWAHDFTGGSTGLDAAVAALAAMAEMTARLAAGQPSAARQVAPPVDACAVVFAADTLRAWLDLPAGSFDTGDGVIEYTVADTLGIDESYSRGAGQDILSRLDDLLAALGDDDEQTAWRLGAGIDNVSLFRSWDGEGCDGALIHVDLTNGLRLASQHHDRSRFASTEDAGARAAVAALACVAAEADALVAAFRRATGGPSGIGADR